MPPSLQTSQYLTILMTERGGAIIFCRILAPPNAPPPPQTSQYLTILMIERGCAIIFCRILPPPNAPPPPLPRRHSTDVTVQYYLNDREKGRGHYFCRILAPPNAPPPFPRRHNIELSIREGGGRQLQHPVRS